MPLQFRWVGEADYDRVAETRLYSYAPASNLLDHFKSRLRQDARGKPGDFLLAERDGVAVGTTTSLSLNMWMRGARLPCQGVAYVGTVKTARRGGAGGEKGIASQLMDRTIRMAREREQVLTALMPFRASYYEHFGYGNAERRIDWTVPLALMPKGDSSGYRFYREGDLPALVAGRQRECEAGQCDVETGPDVWPFWMSQWPDGLVAVEESPADGAIHGHAYFGEDRTSPRAVLKVHDWSADSPAALLRLFHFLGSLRDQYSDATISLPGDFPLNRLLKESQLPHRQVDHPFATAKLITRMQIRVLDHRKVLESLRLPTSHRGSAMIAIKESEGHESKFEIDLDSGRFAVSPHVQSADVEMTDVLWASLVAGDTTATAAQRLGLIAPSVSQSAIDLLDCFAFGPAPFCQEYF